MSECNHKQAAAARQKARDMVAMVKLFTEIEKRYPMAIVNSWNALDLTSHPCPVCKKAGLVNRLGSPTCPICDTVFFHEVDK